MILGKVMEAEKIYQELLQIKGFIDSARLAGPKKSPPGAAVRALPAHPERIWIKPLGAA